MEENFCFDREIGFDIPISYLKPSTGEIFLSQIQRVFDEKGNSGVCGKIQFSNLRLIWFQRSDAKMNQSIGYDTIILNKQIDNQTKGGGNFYKLHLKSYYQLHRYEFIFYTEDEVKNPFLDFQVIFKAYETSKPYRDLKIRGVQMKNDNLMLLDKEKIINKHSNVFSMTKEDGKLGKFILTNIRILWQQNVSENFNVSIPYIMVKRIFKKDSNFGPLINIETNRASGNYMLGFKVDEGLEQVLMELQKLHKTFLQKPYLGIPENLLQQAETDGNYETIETEFGETTFSDSVYNENQNLRAVYKIDEKSENDITFNADLGLTMETQPKGLTAAKLWQIMKF